MGRRTVTRTCLYNGSVCTTLGEHGKNSCHNAKGSKRTDANQKEYHQKKTTNCTPICLCGAGGSRTLVRTRKPYAFYTLILD